MMINKPSCFKIISFSRFENFFSCFRVNPKVIYKEFCIFCNMI